MEITKQVRKKRQGIGIHVLYICSPRFHCSAAAHLVHVEGVQAHLGGCVFRQHQALQLSFPHAAPRARCPGIHPVPPSTDSSCQYFPNPYKLLGAAAVPSHLGPPLLTQSLSWCWVHGPQGPAQAAGGRRSVGRRQLRPCAWSPAGLWAVGAPGRMSQLPHLQ